MSKKIKQDVLVDFLPPINYNWISASQTRNYFLKDTFLDWIAMYGAKKGFEKDNNNLQSSLDFSTYIMRKGNEFEKDIITKLRDRFPNEVIECISPSSFPPKKYHIQIQHTFDLMRKGTPIIYQGIVFNPEDNTFGYPDLIVRSDYLNKIFTNKVISEKREKKGCRFSDDWHYTIIDIKYSTLHLRTKDLVYNEGSIPCYKAQTCIYNNALGYMQHLVPNKAYLLGRGWKTTNDKNKNPFDKAGKVAFFKNDDDIYEKTKDAIFWLKRLKKEGEKWSLYPYPSVVELYPNMSNANSNGWNNAKKEVAERLGEISLIYECGIKQREVAHTSNIYRWDDVKCTSETLGLTNEKTMCLVDNILKINKYNSSSVNNSVNNSVYAFDYEKYKNIKLASNNIICFLDLENVSSINKINGEGEDMTFMIGLTHFSNEGEEGLIHKTFLADGLDSNSEKIMLENFLEYVVNLKGNKNVVFYHWSNAEPMLINKLLTKYNKEVLFEYFDLEKYTKDITFVIKGSYNYSLKSVVGSLAQYKLIDTSYDCDIENGCNATIAAFLAYEEQEQKSDITIFKSHPYIKMIEKYNEIDCRVLYSLYMFYLGLINEVPSNVVVPVTPLLKPIMEEMKLD